MSTNTNKIIFKRLVREYEFLIEDLKDIEAANSEIKDSFRLNKWILWQMNGLVV